MWLQYYGHSAFLLRSEEGVSVCLDPYRSGGYEGALAYAPIADEIDVAILSHDHDDHAAVDALAGGPVTVRAPCLIRGLEVDMLPCFHDDRQGALRGPNRIVIVNIDGLRVAHCGDLGHELDDAQLEALGETDLLCVPVGGTYTIDGPQASRLVARARPRLAVPMHFKTPAIGFPLDGPETFLASWPGARRVGPGIEDQPMRLVREELPAETTILHLAPTHAGPL